MPIGYNPNVINPGGIDYAELTDLVNPPNPANAGKTIVIDESGKPTLGEGGGGGGIEFLTIPITNVFDQEVSDIEANIAVIKGNTSLTFGGDYEAKNKISPATSVEVPMFGDKAKIWNILAHDTTLSVLIVNDITTTGNVTAYQDEETNNWVIEVSGEGTISITWVYQD